MFASDTGREPEDIYHAAMLSILEGDRLWPCGVRFLAFVKMTMRSIASNARKRESRIQLFPLGGDDTDTPDISESRGSISDAGCSAVQELAAAELDRRQLIDRAFAALEDDLDAQMVLLAQLEDKDAAQIKEELELNDTRYAAITKKIKRRLVASVAPKGK